MTFEILPSAPDRPLPDELRQIEGARLVVNETMVGGVRYVKTSAVFPLPNGDRLERIFLFADESGRLRMLGLHAVRRERETPKGETVVFQQSGGSPNPLTGRVTDVPADTYTYLALSTALRGLAKEPKPSTVHLWRGEEGAGPAEIVLEGQETLAVFGAKVPSLRFRVNPRGGGGEALYWFREVAPHSFLQYRGPADFLPVPKAGAPEVLLRATSSSEQTQEVFGSASGR